MLAVTLHARGRDRPNLVVEINLAPCRLHTSLERAAVRMANVSALDADAFVLAQLLQQGRDVAIGHSGMRHRARRSARVAQYLFQKNPSSRIVAARTVAARHCQRQNQLNAVSDAVGGDGLLVPKRAAAVDRLFQHREHLRHADIGDIEAADLGIDIALQRRQPVGTMLRGTPFRPVGGDVGSAHSLRVFLTAAMASVCARSARRWSSGSILSASCSRAALARWRACSSVKVRALPSPIQRARPVHLN